MNEMRMNYSLKFQVVIFIQNIELNYLDSCEKTCVLLPQVDGLHVMLISMTSEHLVEAIGNR